VDHFDAIPGMNRVRVPLCTGDHAIVYGDGDAAPIGGDADMPQNIGQHPTVVDLSLFSVYREFHLF
jgi:hypothetical protein